MHELRQEFNTALSLINVSDARRKLAIEAHTEINGYLESDEQLRVWGLDTALIGSYARHTAIHPGKDVDIFTKLTKLTTATTDPATICERVRDILVARYGDRAEPQNRSIKVRFDTDVFEFSVDVVPAVKMGRRWAIPRRDTEVWRDPDPDRRWVETDPEQLKTLTEQRNQDIKIHGQGAYVPVVKLVRQTRRNHRGKEKPGGFYFELMTYWAFEQQDVAGETFAEVFSSTLSAIATQLAGSAPLIDPVLGREYAPAPEPADRAAAAAVFSDLADDAEAAVAESSRCKAAAIWRRILGENEQGFCFPVPDGCDEHGRALPVTAVGSSRGSREPGGFA